VYLPLMQHTTSEMALVLANSFYRTVLRSADFKLSQAFVNQQGLLSLELIDKVTGEVAVTFVDRTSGVGGGALVEDNAADWVFANPYAATASYEAFMGPAIKVHSPEELVFLKHTLVDAIYPTVAADNELSFRLSRLLNHYQFLGVWVAGTLGEYTAGGFKVIYKGPSAGAPGNFQLEASDLVYIIQILNGKEKGFICLRT